MSRQTPTLIGLGSQGLVCNDPEYITQLVSDVRRFAEVLLSLKEAFIPAVETAEECVYEVVKARLAELLRVLRCVLSKHQVLNSEEILSAAGELIGRVKGLNLKKVNKENRSGVCREIYSSIDTLAFTFGNVVSDFLMGDVDHSSRVELPHIRRSRQVDQVLQQNDTGVESALLYAKAWSKYTKDILSWVEKRLGLDMECAKGFAKMAESAKAAADQQDYMPFRGVYVSAFENELDYNHTFSQTATALQTNKFIQSEAECAVRKARLLLTQRREEYERARGSHCRMGEEQTHMSMRAQERKRRIEEEALQKTEEAQEHYRVCVADAEAKNVHLTKTKSEILSQLRELIFQCDLTLKAVTVNWFQMLYNQLVSVPEQYQMLCDQVKQYEPGQCYSEFVHSLPKERVWLEALSHERAGTSRTEECDSLVVFHGAECEECSLACHKKCLETLAIQCGHKKLQGKLHLFGIDFCQAAKNSADNIPFIIRKCTSEIESRALNIKGIYRLNGAKPRVEKLCQAFENGKDLVELSELYPHDISNVLKLYLRQLPEPLILYRYYNEIIGLAKEAQSVTADNTHSPRLSIELNRIILKIRDLLRHLPPANYRTLHFLITHLHRVSEHAEENKMDTRNLGIIFGPTLIKPRRLDTDVSLSSLVDYPYQALMVELLIKHHQKIFDVQLSPAPSTNPPLTRCSQSLLDIKEVSVSHYTYSGTSDRQRYRETDRKQSHKKQPKKFMIN
ncbi:Rho GTPase-activating protein 29 [Bagarius yarrelli]|uniref:Rho GTPase-activating protein 29 n=1 Tax=Bagarius yarrelli TaxID=175774 RepID=A0A556TIA7_BAGYA|nr:Rho GTPase-activating protein 29 [Bagarius yarrelli]